MSKQIKVTVTVNDRRITLEGPEEFVRAEVERFALLKPVEGSRDSSPAGELAAERAGHLTERSLVEEKKPQGHAETVAVLAYFLTSQGKAEFTPEEIRRAYIRAGVRPPKVVGQALRDAKNLSDYIESGSSRGTFKLSPHGERTVLFDLPTKQTKKS
ncbi:MAG TPA: hypothetical protein VNZ63_04950 [Verrucomicrobiae bacterium]|jgi:hypothetical protein|nr:hypothetical protein [Verrucomicrobiae bacterium]